MGVWSVAQKLDLASIVVCQLAQMGRCEDDCLVRTICSQGAPCDAGLAASVLGVSANDLEMALAPGSNHDFGLADKVPLPARCLANLDLTATGGVAGHGDEGAGPAHNVGHRDTPSSTTVRTVETDEAPVSGVVDGDAKGGLSQTSRQQGHTKCGNDGRKGTDVMKGHGSAFLGSVTSAEKGGSTTTKGSSTSGGKGTGKSSSSSTSTSGGKGTGKSSSSSTSGPRHVPVRQAQVMRGHFLVPPRLKCVRLATLGERGV